ncbi:hypothetical protein GE21DRAFT_9639 [Neurospora crassa]|uniref:Uncharacterized protein n=1 Tax=Neurospora crassa (strain ATCC 24698 / 74-OR23-1A / CBS 708.71 / DSM 1257 / FGSC 987) TaxID=367110 RepID=Q7S1I6_NEUCR|nr:hypothetical protein NCU09295 [Neurospora crassa OR74A]EAA29205.1 hypothetical protein NCU09295 [Neurospora crassa OR74A]KHE84164.1 hypothetical protein GE21DRAFT_9639 [Neurospora crassa]|eukprot:XP_958441.1 hypothetical protein NCU09295 [Neurospora crassa OR74A]
MLPAKLHVSPLRIVSICACIFVLFYIYGQLGAGILDVASPPQRYAGVPASPPEKAPELPLELVVASMKYENTTWFHEYLPDWPASIYVVDDPDAPLTVPKNKGHEAMVYLTHLIDRYDTLASTTVFVHAQRFAWHNDDPDYDALVTLRHLQTPYVQTSGYVNLRCVWVLGCPAEVRPNLDVQDLKDLSASGEVALKDIFKPAFKQILPGVPVPEVVGVSCCSQFAVSRETVRNRTREDYVRLREWLLNTELDDSLSGRVFEYTWHIIFGKAAVHCPDAGECYCKVFGLCGLEGCKKDGCDGRYTLPRVATLPSGWPRLGWEGEDRGYRGPPV